MLQNPKGFGFGAPTLATTTISSLLGLCVFYCARIGCKWLLELVRSSSPSMRSLLMFILSSMWVCCGVYHLPCITQIIFELGSFFVFWSLQGEDLSYCSSSSLQIPIMQGFIFFVFPKVAKPKGIKFILIFVIFLLGSHNSSFYCVIQNCKTQRRWVPPLSCYLPFGFPPPCPILVQLPLGTQFVSHLIPIQLQSSSLRSSFSFQVPLDSSPSLVFFGRHNSPQPPCYVCPFISKPSLDGFSMTFVLFLAPPCLTQVMLCSFSSLHSQSFNIHLVHPSVFCFHLNWNPNHYSSLCPFLNPPSCVPFSIIGFQFGML